MIFGEADKINGLAGYGYEAGLAIISAARRYNVNPREIAAAMQNAELLGFVPIIAAAVTGATGIATAIAKGIAKKREQKRQAKMQEQAARAAAERDAAALRLEQQKKTTAIFPALALGALGLLLLGDK
ncbi:hypothetical protein EH223_08520 [candidate division KSB1 bacterium]|nr:MAG: hypothetical protein EH223_08520 [candidate division KSB1 bacterium]